MHALELKVIPVLDLLSGQVVRGVKGERSRYRPIVSPLVGGSEPVTLAKALLEASGSDTLYIADLDAIQGGPLQHEVLRSLLAALPETSLWLDGGFAGPEGVRALQDSLAAAATGLRPVYASESLAEEGALAAIRNDPSAILSLDCRLQQPLDPAGCWLRPALWPATVISMTLDRVGAAAGPDLQTLDRLRALAPDRHWVGAGGIRSRTDLRAAQAAGAEAWLVASALHDGGLDHD
jgi:phosphoribosylformimino-5-aminoimidazole carboxamide ribotide isomerase